MAGTRPRRGTRRRRLRFPRARSSRSSRRAGHQDEARGPFRPASAAAPLRASRGRLRIGASGRQGRDESCRALSRARREAPSRTTRSAAARPHRLERSSPTVRPRAARSSRANPPACPRTSVATISPSSLHCGGNRRRLASGRRARVEHARRRSVAATSVATICDASSCTTKRPVSARGVRRGLPVRTTHASGAKRPGSTWTPCDDRDVDELGAGGPQPCWRESSAARAGC